MLTITVTECRLELEPVGPDPFIVDLTPVAPVLTAPAYEAQSASASRRRIVD